MGDLIPSEILEAFRKRKERKADVKTLYYSWLFFPKDASVELHHPGETDRANRKYHLEHNSDPDTVHGYAYRIKGGWRVTDWEHKTCDKYIANQVISAIERKEAHS